MEPNRIEWTIAFKFSILSVESGQTIDTHSFIFHTELRVTVSAGA